jgi:transcriptional regulator with XRE-family HTH domain
MTPTERLQRYKARTGFTQDQLAAMFDVDPSSIRNWLAGKNEMRGDHLRTLLRFEADFLASPKSSLSPTGRRVFTEGRHGHCA